MPKGIVLYVSLPSLGKFSFGYEKFLILPFPLPGEIFRKARSLWTGTCNSTIFLSRRFHRPIYFLVESTLIETPVGVP